MRTARSLAAVGAAALTIVLLPAAPALAAPITVTTTNDELNADGDCSLREAIQAANMDQPVSGCPAGSGPDQINLPAGLFSIGIDEPTEAGNNQGDFDLHSDITITGAGPALTTVGAGKTDRVFEQHSFGHTSAINQLTVRNGDATTSVGFQGGGGIFNNGGSTLMLDNVVVRGSTAPEGGGGIFNFGSLTVTNSTITGNSSPGSNGGGISSQFGQLTLQSSSVTMNTAEAAGGVQSQGNLTVTDSIISSNTATTFSAGGLVNDGFAILTNNTIDDNNGNIGAGIDNHGDLTIHGGSVSGNDANEQGGGVRNTGGHLQMNGVTVANNSANDGGGGLAAFGGFTNIFGGTTFSGNTTDEGGGAIRAGGELLMTGGTIDGNQAALSGCCGGGGLSVDQNAFVTLQGVTLSNNSSAQDAGGAIFNFGRLRLENTVVTGNSVAGQGGGIHNDPGGFLRMTGGQITSNTAQAGGGLSAEGFSEAGASTTHLDGVTVSDNVATDSDGGGIFGNGRQIVLDIRNTTISGNEAENGQGGGMVARGLSSLENTVVSGNTAFWGGGIEVTEDAQLTIADSTVTGNVAQEVGGGMQSSGAVRMVATDITGNTANIGGGIRTDGDSFLEIRGPSSVTGNEGLCVDTGQQGCGGGGIANDGGFIEMIAVEVSDNVLPSTGWGAGISNHGAMRIHDSGVTGNCCAGGISNPHFAPDDPEGMPTMLVGRTTVSGNTGETGGGIFNNGVFRLTDSTVSGNTAEFGGGIADGGEGTLSVNHSTISGNDAEYAGGISEQGELDMRNSTVSGNSAVVEGGGMQVWTDHGPIEPTGEGAAVVRFSTFADNSAPFAAAFNNQAGESDVLLKNSILGDSVGGADCEWPFSSGGFNIVENPGPGCVAQGKTAGNQIGIDPMLGPLADNGGPTMTHSLLGGSPAIDAASPVCPPPPTDQRYEMRGWGDGCDDGAFERVVPSVVFFEVFETVLLPSRSVRAEGEILCGPAGDRWTAQLTLRQRGRHGAGSTKGICTGEPDAWSAVISPAASSAPFGRGPAELCADVRSFSGSVQTDRDQLCFGVDIR